MASAQTKYIRERNINRALQLDNDRLHDLNDEMEERLQAVADELAIAKHELKLKGLH